MGGHRPTTKPAGGQEEIESVFLRLKYLSAKDGGIREGGVLKNSLNDSRTPRGGGFLLGMLPSFEMRRLELRG